MEQGGQDGFGHAVYVLLHHGGEVEAGDAVHHVEAAVGGEAAEDGLGGIDCAACISGGMI